MRLIGPISVDFSVKVYLKNLMSKLLWPKQEKIQTLSYTCGFCGHLVGAENGWHGLDGHGTFIYAAICPHCSRITQKNNKGWIFPLPMVGEVISSVPSPAKELYQEIRGCMQVGAFTGAVALCRTMIAHISHDKLGTKRDDTFQNHLKALYDSELLAKGQRDWIDSIKDSAGKGIHDLEIIKRDEAESIFEFTQMMLKIMYDYPARKPAPRSKAP
ncbi:MAG TPA: DUF4145 domain-containing protein [Fimbriimonas sp.]|nr:DUF4145 domain-containing protein [Fimbriimonas sp.]